MAQIALSVISTDEHVLLQYPVASTIEGEDIKYVVSDYPYSKVFYYDAHKSRMVELLVEETPAEILALVTTLKLVTLERKDSVNVTRAMLINPNSIAYSVALSPKDEASLSYVTYSSLAVGTFAPGDVVTGSVTKATALVIFDNGSNKMTVHPLNGTLSTSDSLANQLATPVTADVDTYTAFDQSFVKYDNGEHVAVNTKDLTVLNKTVLNKAITDVDADAHTFTVATDLTAKFLKDVPFYVEGSTGNDMMFTTVSSVVDSGSTVITVRENIADATADGTIKA